MTRLIVTTDSSTAGAIQQAGLADLVIAIERRLVWGPLPSAAERDAFFAPRTTQPHGLHWLDDTPSWRLEELGAQGSRTDRAVRRNMTRSSFGSRSRAKCAIDSALAARSLAAADAMRISNLVMRQLVVPLVGGDARATCRKNSISPIVELTQGHDLKLASRAWRAYCAPTPQSLVRSLQERI